MRQPPIRRLSVAALALGYLFARPAIVYAQVELTPFVLPDRIISIGGYAIVRSGDSRPVGGGGELNYWRLLPFWGAAYGGVDLGATDRGAYGELQLGDELGEWPNRQILAGIGVGGGIRWHDQPDRAFAQATLWANLRFRPSNIPSFIFPFFRVEWHGSPSFQGGLMFHLPFTN
jgi:hypothetical protein